MPSTKSPKGPGVAASRTGVFALRSCSGGPGGCVLGLLGACRAGCGPDHDDILDVIIYDEYLCAIFDDVDDVDGFPDHQYHHCSDVDDVDDFPVTVVGAARSTGRYRRADGACSAHADRGSGFGLGADPVQALSA